MRFSEIKGKAVVELQVAKKLGDVDDLLIELANNQVIALVLQKGIFSHSAQIPLSQVKNIGNDAIMVSQEGVTPMSVDSGSNSVALSSLLNNKVVTDSGSYIGHITDVVLDNSSLSIISYEYKPEGLFAKAQEFAMSPQIHYGESILTVPNQLVNKTETK